MMIEPTLRKIFIDTRTGAQVSPDDRLSHDEMKYVDVCDVVDDPGFASGADRAKHARSFGIKASERPVIIYSKLHPADDMGVARDD